MKVNKITNEEQEQLFKTDPEQALVEALKTLREQVKLADARVQHVRHLHNLETDSHFVFGVSSQKQ